MRRLRALERRTALSASRAAVRRCRNDSDPTFCGRVRRANVAFLSRRVVGTRDVAGLSGDHSINDAIAEALLQRTKRLVGLESDDFDLAARLLEFHSEHVVDGG